MSYPYDYENVLLIDSELSPVDEEIEEKVNHLTFVFLSNYVNFYNLFLIARRNTWKNWFCLQRCVYDPDDINGHDKTNDDARKKLISAAILSVVFMVKSKSIKSHKSSH